MKYIKVLLSSFCPASRGSWKLPGEQLDASSQGLKGAAQLQVCGLRGKTSSSVQLKRDKIPYFVETGQLRSLEVQ